MKQKTKTRLATLGLVSTSAVGLGCIGFGIYAISQMRHPYLNQWVDFQKEKNYRPIVNQVSKDEIAAILHVRDQDLTEQDVCNFYLSKIAITPEVFVEDFIETKYHFFELPPKENLVWKKYIIRMSDVSLSTEEVENETKYFIHFRWDQDIHGQSGYQNDQLIAKWVITLDKVPISVSKDADKWAVKVDLDAEGWTGTVQIDAVEGFDGQETCVLQPISHDNYDVILTNDYFNNFSFKSHYLDRVDIN